jgi:hypothetical protein
VFFDVRSTARSLRISWYSDTGVAVLSIWQGGTCTGSFRLPMGDVPRLIAALQAGPPAGDSPGAAPARYGRAARGGGPARPGGQPPQPAARCTPRRRRRAAHRGPGPGSAAVPHGGSGPYPASPVPASLAQFQPASSRPGPAPVTRPPRGRLSAARLPGRRQQLTRRRATWAAPAAAAPPVSPYPADPVSAPARRAACPAARPERPGGQPGLPAARGATTAIPKGITPGPATSSR